jgi:TatD DNase family protein
MLAIGTGDGPPDLEPAIRLADTFQLVYATVGVHPHNAAKAEDRTFDELRALLQHPKVLALGEIGLDYHYDFAPRERQQEVFIEQMRIAQEFRKPIVIHTREAWDETFGLLRAHWAPSGLPGIMHCFTGGPEEARMALDLGFFLSFGGVVTFPKAVANQDAARLVRLDRLLVETDAPYLAPGKFRGKRCEPAYVTETAKVLAEVRGVSEAEIARQTTENFFRLFSKVPRPAADADKFKQSAQA